MNNVLGLLATCVTLGGRAGPPPPDVFTPSSSVESIARALKKSSFLFTAKVVALRGSTTGSVPASPCTMVVRFTSDDKTYVMPAGMKWSGARKITLVADQVQNPGNSQVLIFAYGISADSGLALHQVALMPMTGVKRTTIDDLLGKARAFLLAEELGLLAEEASAMMIGSVDSVTASLAAGSATPRRETSELSNWRQAFVVADRLYKTDTIKVGSHVRVMFLQYPDSRYPDAPSLAVGSRYLIALQPFSRVDSAARAGISPKGRYVVLEQRDVRPSQDSLYIVRNPR